mgnify:CR=1 FL=1
MEGNPIQFYPKFNTVLYLSFCFNYDINQDTKIKKIQAFKAYTNSSSDHYGAQKILPYTTLQELKLQGTKIRDGVVLSRVSIFKE